MTIRCALALALCGCLHFCSLGFAGPALNVVLTGDSITGGLVGYADEFAASFGTQFPSTFVGRPGLTADLYINEQNTNGDNYAEQVVALDPDVIVFMLGINDALKSNPTSATGSYLQFRNRLTTAFDLFDSSTASRVLILSILPVEESNLGWLGSNGPSTNERVDGTGTNTSDPTDLTFGYNPWLQREVAQRNSDADIAPTYEYIDLNSTFDLSLLDTDGLHLTDQVLSNDPFSPGRGTIGNGQQQLANQVFSAITAVPEPSAALALSMLAVFCIVGRRR